MRDRRIGGMLRGALALSAAGAGVLVNAQTALPLFQGGSAGSGGAAAGASGGMAYPSGSVTGLGALTGTTGATGPSAAASSGAGGAPGQGQMQTSGSGSTMPSIGNPPGIPTLTSGQLPTTTLPTSGPPPAMNVQFPPATVTAYDGTVAPLFGTSLFTGAFAGSTMQSRSDYQIQVGDTVEVKTFGNMSLDVVGRVDSSGRLFLPIIGPVMLRGISRQNLNTTLQTAVSSVYSNTRVYADIVQPGSVGVFVSGLIQRPGRYLGSTNDDILYYLDKAGGIDGQRGSFRDVVVRHRDGGEEHYDLYDFLTEGRTGPARFADGDVIIVRPRGPQVVVTGMALRSYAFELKAPPGTRYSDLAQAGISGGIADAGTQVLRLAKPNARLVTGAYVRSVRDREPVSSYMPFEQFAGVALGDGDHVDFRSDSVARTIAVSVQVTQPIPSVFVVPRTATLQDVLNQIPQDSPTADYRSVYILRRKVAMQQAVLLQEALLRLQKDALGATALNVAAPSSSASAASQVPAYIAAASKLQPSGQIAIYRNGRFQNILLEDGDQIVIPDKSDVVQVGGEALNPGAFAFRPGARLREYVNDAGGYNIAADRHRFILRKPNGIAEVVKDDAIPEAGDQILLIPHVRGQTLLAIQTISQLLLPISVAASSIIRN